MNRENVIKGYMICVEHGILNGEDCHGYHQWKDNHYEIEKINDYSKECPYNGCETGCVKTLAKDTLALLKEKEAVEPIPFFTETGAESPNYVICGHCKSIKAIMPKYTKQKYCHECGFPVLWEGR